MTRTIKIDGMACEHCVKSVEKALSEVEGVKAVKVSLEGKEAIVEASDEVSSESLKEAVEDKGFEVTEII